jgi:uncharacterized protein (DUF362 family)/ferredoxin
MARVAVCKAGEGETAVRETTLRTIDMLGGISKYILPGMRVLIKPNFVAPVETAVTDFVILRTLVESVQKAGATPFLGECPGFEFDSEATFRFLRIREFAGDCGVEVINFEFDRYVEVPFSHPKVPRIRVAKSALEADAIINVPRMKSHKLTTLSLGIKNCFGMVERTSRRYVHAMGIDHGIAALYKLFKPAFTLVDGLTVPAEGAVYGEYHKFGVLAASEDMLSVDIVCSRLLGADPADIKHIAMVWGDRSMQPEVVGDRVQPIRVTGLEDTGKRRTYRKIYQTVYAADHYLSKTGAKTIIPWFHRKLGIHPVVDWSRCNNCGKCTDVCPVDAVNLANRKLDDAKCGRVRCLKCVEVCEPGAISVKQAFRSG